MSLSPILLLFKSESLDMLDFYSDFKLAIKTYGFCRQDFDSELGQASGHYNICFVWICLSIFSPLILQYATLNS